MEFNNVKYGAENDGAIEMVQITPDAEKFINDLLEKNQKVGYGIKIYLSGFACSGPQFGMSFQEKAAEGENVDKSAHGFDMFYDDETKKELEECVIEFIDDPNFGTGLTIRNPNFNGCASLRRRMPLNGNRGARPPNPLSYSINNAGVT